MNISLTLSIGSDHAGFLLKQKIIAHLQKHQITLFDKGCFSEVRADYPDYAHAVVGSILSGESRFGILICGSGNGINMTANKYKGIRSALCWSAEIAVLARQHNDANIIALPARFITPEEAINSIEAFLTTEFEGGRHLDRIQKIDP